MAHQILSRPRPPAVTPDRLPVVDFDTVFWHGAVGNAMDALPELAARSDLLAQRVTQLPMSSILTRPVVGQYLSMVKTLASAWPLHSRPALLAAVESLLHVGQALGPEAAVAHSAGQGRAVLRVAEALQRRLAAPTTAFAALGADLASYLAQMGRITTELDADTRLVTERLQADQVHVFLLSQQASQLQSRPGAGGLLAPDGPLAQVHAELAQLHAAQAATRAEADYLQAMLPVVAPYLAVATQMGQAIVAMVDALQALGMGLASLQHSPAGMLAAAATALQSALPHWQAQAAAAARLQPALRRQA
jgi:hypothetical protein